MENHDDINLLKPPEYDLDTKKAFKMEKHKYYTDQERYEHCRRCRISGKTVSEYAKENGLKRTTLRDWMHTYRNIHGGFINVNTVSKKENYGKC